MAKRTRKLRAIDLYSGVGGWSLGLRLAGIDVVGSYELWGAANETNFKNNKHQAQTIDVRRLSPDELPEKIDIVVGSPPCTQFSFSNRGGGGNIAEGLRDIMKFLSVVDYLKPKVWAMENVPRVATIIEQELGPGGRLRKFQHLNIRTHVVNMEDYGVPQRRRRCIAGNFNFDLLEEYVHKAPKKTLGDIVRALAANIVVDPIYKLRVPRKDLIDHVVESHLNEEEIRINRANKTGHPVYNRMLFPDSLDRSVRTITATCTRVSRESVIIKEVGKRGKFRRLSIRERASLQGFPITFQFYGRSYSEKLRMIGNAIPPVFCYHLAQAFKGVTAAALPAIAEKRLLFRAPKPKPATTPPDRQGTHFPATRTFRFAIPSLRLKSGVRFELANSFAVDEVTWRVAFYFGTSKFIHSLRLDNGLGQRLIRAMPRAMGLSVSDQLIALKHVVLSADIANMQRVWSHRGVGGTRPFMLLDQLDQIGAGLVATLGKDQRVSEGLVETALAAQYGSTISSLSGLSKLARNAPLIVAGLLLASVANAEMAKRGSIIVKGVWTRRSSAFRVRGDGSG